MGLRKDSRKLLLTPPASALLLSSVIVGNTHGQLAEIDLRQGEWTREPWGRGRGGRKGRIHSQRVQWSGEPSFRCRLPGFKSWFHQKL